MIDVIYLGWNRLAFTEFTFRALLDNTDWDRVNELIVYDDGSTDGTRQFLDEAIQECPAAHRLIHVGWGSPVAVMNHYVETHREMVVPMFAKVDNDIAVPPGWLGEMHELIESNPAIDLLGMEAGQTRVAWRDGEPWDGRREFRPSSHIGGVGLMRLRAFKHRKRIPAMGRHGFTSWQSSDESLVRGWISPDLACPQLDRMPFEPWLSLAETYRARRWQREWPTYDERMMAWAWEWFPQEAKA